MIWKQAAPGGHVRRQLWLAPAVVLAMQFGLAVPARAISITSGPTVPTLTVNGLCSSSEPSTFTTSLSGTGTTNDNATTLDFFDVLLLDGNDIVIGGGGQHIGFNSPFSLTIDLQTSADTSDGPLQIVVYERDESGKIVLYGQTTPYDDSEIVAQVAFNARALDSDCPGDLIGPNAEDKAGTSDSLLLTFVSVGGSMFGDDIVTDESGGTTGGLNLSLSAATPTRPDEGANFGFAERFQPDNAGFNFAIDLGRMAERMAGKGPILNADLPEAGAPLIVSEEAAPRHVIPWITGRYTDFSDDSAIDRDGHLWAINTGLTVRLAEGVFIGAFGRYREGEVSSAVLDASLDSSFLGAGAFLQYGRAEHMRLKLGGLYEWGDNDIVTAGDNGDFDTTQWTLEGKLDRRFEHGAIWFEPGVGLIYAGLDRDAYTDSGGNAVAASDQSYGRFTYGTTIGMTSEVSAGTLKHFVSINGNWAFAGSDDFTLSTGEVLTSEAHSIALGGGVAFAASRGMMLRARGDYFTDFGDGLAGWTVSGGVGLPLASMFGDGLGGALNLDVSGNTGAQSAKADITIPLN